MALFNFSRLNKPLPEKPKDMRFIKFTKRQEFFMERDMKGLKTAYTSSTMPGFEQRGLLYEIYRENLIFDAHLRGITEKRTLSVINQTLNYFDQAGNVIEHEIFKSHRFNQMLKDVFETVYWGFTVIQFEKEGGKFGYYLYPRELVNAENLELLTDQYSQNGYPIELFENAVTFGEQGDMGLFMPAGVYSIFKRNLLGDWAQYSEQAGMMLNMIKGTGNDKLTEKAITDVYDSIGSGASVNIPEGVDMDFKNLSSGSQNALFENFFDTMNGEQSKLILGQKLTTDEGSGSLSQAVVHAAQQGIILNADTKYLLSFLNSEFRQSLGLWGVSDTGYFAFDDSEQLTTSEKLDNDLKLMQLGYIFAPEYLKERYGIND